jgi:transcriptional regulator with XRE-family HTH domain
LVRARGVTQRELGDQRRNVQRILRGDNVTVDTIAEVAAALGCEVRIAFRRRAGDTDGATGVATTCGVESGGRTLVGNPKE